MNWRHELAHLNDRAEALLSAIALALPNSGVSLAEINGRRRLVNDLERALRVMRGTDSRTDIVLFGGDGNELVFRGGNR